ncbi:MAG: DUF423 domain-containing protein [Hyphomicrobiales bacterium]|nr:DUF423 domain-containing protein [Hyphomicrobiales bacterium]
MPSRLLIFASGICGAAGVGLAALAAHGGSPNISVAATFLLAHAPALLAIGLMGFNAALRWAAAVLFIGVVLFSCDLVVSDLADDRLFPMAAPAGGFMMIVGWLGIAVAAFLPRRLIG